MMRRSDPLSPESRGRVRAKRRALLAGAAFGALVGAAANPAPALAQAINANPTTTAGSVTYSRAGPPTPGTETITVNTPSAIIVWNPAAGPVPNPYVFLPFGNTVTFENANNPDFAVLNRVNINVPIRFDGTVLSRISDSLGRRPGGTVLFSSPGGIIVGGTAVFDVGNLVLTSLNVVDDGAGNFITPSGGFAFNLGSAAPDSAVITESGAQILASSDNSYVALVAPVIDHGGAIRVNGSTGFIAGEALSFSVDQGLFDIVVTTGSDNPFPITHNGTTGGPASTGVGDNHGIYAVAVPKNVAIQMLLGGNMGYDLAVGVDNGAIVLSAGHNIVGGAIDVTPASTIAADLLVGAGTFTSDVTGRAIRDALAIGPSTFSESLTLDAQRSASVIAAGADITIGGALSLTAQGLDGTGGTVRLEANNGQIDVGGDVILRAESDANIGVAVLPGTGADAVGGTIDIIASSGDIVVGGSLIASATGRGGVGLSFGGNGQGGAITLDQSNGSIRTTGDLLLDARGSGGSGDVRGGNGTGGTAQATSGTSGPGLVAGGTLLLDASGAGGAAALTGVRGDGRGGSAILEGIFGNISATTAIIVRADGGGGQRGGGYGEGGTARVSLDHAGLTTADLVISAVGAGGAGIPTAAPDGYDGQGGNASLLITEGGVTVDSLAVDARGIGGAGGASDVVGGSGGSGTGGTATVSGSGSGSSSWGDALILATGIGGAGGAGLDVAGASTGGAGGAGQGGDVLFEATDGPGGFTPASTRLDATGRGGRGGDGSSGASGGDGGAGGNGTGGTVTVRAANLGAISDGSLASLLSLDARGTGGDGGTGGSQNADSGFGGRGGDGGEGHGGEALIDVAGGTIFVRETDMLADGAGGAGGEGGMATGAGDPNFNGQQGVGRVATGGLVEIGVADAGGNSGEAYLGDAELSASAGGSFDTLDPDIAGRIVIRDLGISAQALRFNSLRAEAFGLAPSPLGPGLDLSSTVNPILVDGFAAIFVTGDARVAASGTGGLAASGTVDINASDQVSITHALRPGGTATIAGASIGISGGDSIVAAPGTLIAASSGVPGFGDAAFSAPLIDVDLVTASRDIVAVNPFTPISIRLGSATAGRDIFIDGREVSVTTAQAGDDFSANATGAFTAGSVTTTGAGTDDDAGIGQLGGSVISIDANGDLRLDQADAAGAMRLISFTGSVTGGTWRSGAETDVEAELGNVDVDTVDAAGFISLAAGGTIDAASLTSADSMFVIAVGDARLGTLGAGTHIEVQGANISLLSATAGRDATLRSPGDIAITTGQAGDDFVVDAGGAFTGGTLVATGLGTDNESGAEPLIGSNISVVSAADLSLDDASAADAIELASGNGSVLSSGTLTGGRLDVDAAVDILLNDVDVDAGLDLFAGAGDIVGNRFTSGGDIILDADNVTLAAGDSGGSISISAEGIVDVDSLVAVDDVLIDPISIILGIVVAGGDITLDATQDISVGFADAGDDFVATAGTTFTGGTVIARGLRDSEQGVGPLASGNIFVDAGGNLRVDNGDAVADVDLASSGASVLGNTLLAAGSDIRISAAQDIDIADGAAGETIDLAAAAGLIDAGDLIATAGPITTASGGATTIASADSGAGISVTAGTAADLGILDAATDIDVDAASIAIADAAAGRDIDLDAAGNITIVQGQAGDDFIAEAGGTFTGTEVTVTDGGTDNDSEDIAGQNIVIAAAGDLRLDDGTAPGRVDLTSGGTIFSDGTLRGRELNALAALDLLLHDVFVDDGLSLVAESGSISGNSFTSGGGIALDALQSVTLASADSGGGISIFAGGAADIGSLVAEDDVLIQLTSLILDSVVAGGAIVLEASQDITLGLADAGSDFTASAGTTFDAGTIIARGTGDDDNTGSGSPPRLAAAPPGSGNITVLAGGDLNVDNAEAAADIQLTSGGNLSLDAAIAGAGISLAAAGDIAFGTGEAGDDFEANAGGSFTGSDVTVTGAWPDDDAGTLAGHNIVIRAAGDLRLDNGTAPDRVELISDGGSILSDGTLASDRLLAQAAGDLALNDVTVVQSLGLTAPGGSISGHAFSSGGDISLLASDDVRVDVLDSGGQLVVGAGGLAELDDANALVDILVDAAEIFIDRADAGRDIILTSGGDVTALDILAGRDFVASGGGDGSFGDIAAGSIAVDVAGLAGFSGAAVAPTITVVSSDIAITGSLGDADTEIVALAVRQSGFQTVLGGSSQGPGYTLTGDEAGRITAAALAIDAPATGTDPARAADVLVRDLTLSGQQVGSLEITTPGILQVEGGLLLAGVRSGGGIAVIATERLEILNPAGSIRVRDDAGLSDGSLSLTSNNIWSASQVLLDRLQADPDFAGRDEALLANDGPVEPRGYIEAGDVTLAVRDSLFVQNSGTLESFAGITVRDTTLHIVPTGTLPLRVFAFGSRINPDGSFVTNLNFFNEVDYQDRNGVVGYTDDAQFNLCFINTGICSQADPDDPLPGGPEIIEEPVGGSFGITLPGAASDLVDTSFADEPLIDEPVTSGGDSILWDCDNDDDGDCDEDDYDG